MSQSQSQFMEWVVKYQPLASSVDAPFWVRMIRRFIEPFVSSAYKGKVLLTSNDENKQDHKP